jgi:hypothetical protein
MHLFIFVKIGQKTNKILRFTVAVTPMVFFMSASSPNYTKPIVVWKLNDTSFVNGIKPIVLGAPQIIREPKRSSVMFDGIHDGLVMPVNPLQRLKHFTVEILFKPAVSDSAAPRMLHIQDEEGNRCTIELRITKQGKWYLDTFLKNGKINKGLTLFDSPKQHLCDQWYWVALVYDGHTMTQYVNAMKEMEGVVALNTMISGQTSIGVRLNRINWFKGQISEIRFNPVALKTKSLQRKIK